ncbi:hypothetical protein THAOC_37620, partial [Thalassiosira oceanica]
MKDLCHLLPAIVAVVFSLVLATLAADDLVTATYQDSVACVDVNTGRYPTWEDAPTSAEEFGHDNPEEICRLPIHHQPEEMGGRNPESSGRVSTSTWVTPRATHSGEWESVWAFKKEKEARIDSSGLDFFTAAETACLTSRRHCPQTNMAITDPQSSSGAPPSKTVSVTDNIQAGA